MRIEISDAELDYVYRLLVSRPMAEVEPLVIKLRVQIQQATTRQDERFSDPKPNGSLGDSDPIALP